MPSVVVRKSCPWEVSLWGFSATKPLRGEGQAAVCWVLLASMYQARWALGEFLHCGPCAGEAPLCWGAPREPCESTPLTATPESSPVRASCLSNGDRKCRGPGYIIFAGQQSKVNLEMRGNKYIPNCHEEY